MKNVVTIFNNTYLTCGFVISYCRQKFYSILEFREHKISFFLCGKTTNKINSIASASLICRPNPSIVLFTWTRKNLPAIHWQDRACNLNWLIHSIFYSWKLAEHFSNLPFKHFVSLNRSVRKTSKGILIYFTLMK